MTPDLRFEMFFKEHYTMLCRRVYRILRDENLAEDLVQEVFLKVWEKRNSLELNDQFISYLKKSCYHEALQYIKSNKAQAFLEPPSELASNLGTDDDVISRELELKVLEGIDLLPDKSKLVFSLSRYELMTYKDIAHTLDISIKSVEKHMSKALKHMRNHLQDYMACILSFLFLK